MRSRRYQYKKRGICIYDSIKRWGVDRQLGEQLKELFLKIPEKKRNKIFVRVQRTQKQKSDLQRIFRLCILITLFFKIRKRCALVRTFLKLLKNRKVEMLHLVSMLTLETMNPKIYVIYFKLLQ